MSETSKGFTSLALAAIVVAGFVGFVATHAVRANVVNAEFFDHALSESKTYERLYDELLADAEFAPQIDRLLGGVDVKREEVVTSVRRVVKPEQLEQIGKALVQEMVAHFAKGQKLELAIDITPIIRGIHDTALAIAVIEIEQLPKQRVSYERGVAELDRMLDPFRATGAFPKAIPVFKVPAAHVDAVANRLTAGAPLSDADAAALRASLADGNTPRALELAAPVLLARLIAESIDKLTKNDLVTIVNEPDGPHYILHPGEKTKAEIDQKLERIQRLNAEAGWVRVVALAAMILGLVALFALHRGDRVRRITWPGGALLAAGVAGFIGWLIARGVVAADLRKIVEGEQNLPPALRAILADLATDSVGELTPAIWIPSIAIAVAGLALVAFALLTRAGRRR